MLVQYNMLGRQDLLRPEDLETIAVFHEMKTTLVGMLEEVVTA